ncbi:MAG: T9SS type A sorting domain-containing protein [Bacteroidia bacterium]
MKNKNKFSFLGAALLSMMAAGASAQCGLNLVSNGDFEAGNSGFTSGYTFKTDVAGNSEMIPENTYGVDDNINTYHPLMTGISRSGNFLMVNGNTGSLKTVWSQNIDVLAGSEYTISVWVQNIYPVSPAVLRFNVGGNLVGTFSPTGIATWQEFTATYVATSTGNVSFSILNSNLTAFGNDFGIDDISFVRVCPVPTPSGCFAVDVYDVNQGLTKLGTAVNPERSIPTNALGAPNGQNPAVYAPVQNFFSLGFGGSIVLAFAEPIANGPGNDIRIYESSASVNNETATIEVSQDGLGFTPVGTITQTGEVDFGTAFNDYIQFVRIVDITNIATWGNSQVADGFDVDAIECLHGAYEEPTPVSCSPNEVISYSQGPVQDLISPVAAARSIVENALGAPENSDATTSPENNNFYTLGFGGEIVLKFPYPIKNGDGNDIFVVETTFGSATSNNCSRYPERVRAFASQDGCNWVYLGEGCQDTYFDLGGLGWAQYVKLIDVTPVANFAAGGDAYDLDGIICLHGQEENPVPAALADGASEVVEYNPALRANGTPIVAARTNAANALGAPQGTDVINFVSLGFGGNLTLKFPYVVFVNPAANELSVTETTFGNPSCAAYPEKAEFEGSLDGINWVSLGELCLDGQLNTDAAGPIQYIRISDRSAASSFTGTADGYDVDGIVVINSLCGPSSAPRIADDVTTPNEVAGIELYPNPVSDFATVTITTGDMDSFAMITVNNYVGQQISSEKFNVASSSAVTRSIDMSALTNGVYFVTVETNNSREVIKVVKN